MDVEFINQRLKSLFKESNKIVSLQPMHGGAQKVTYRVTCENGWSCIVHVWDLSKNYVLSHQPTESDNHPLGASYGAALLECNTAYLKELGVRVPEVYEIDRTKAHYPFDYAIVEDIGKTSLQPYLAACPESSGPVLNQLKTMLMKMHQHHSDKYGPIQPQGDNASTCEHLVLEQTFQDLQHASDNIPQIAIKQELLRERLIEFYSSIQPRKHFGLIHSELGPDHVMINKNEEPVLIDIEGVKFFDIEYEHAFLSFRFGEHYKSIQNSNLDRNRLRFYKLHHHLSCISGPLEIINNGFPDPEVMKDIIRFNTEAALDFLQ